VKNHDFGEGLRRDSMVRQLAAQGIEDSRVLEALRRVPRHLFVPDTKRHQAYHIKRSLGIGADQTISQPWVVARMTELLQTAPGQSVLEIGSGSGYQTAVLSLLVQRVYSLERVPHLARDAIQRMRDLGIGNVKIQIFDGTVGWSEVGPFDRILVTAGAPEAPTPLLDQLKLGGRLLIPEGTRDQQRLMRYERQKDRFVQEELDEVSFVPLIGRHGWSG
jgi:protein-L-isoaspartate(D-aspartate) O-methyltransferase